MYGAFLAGHQTHTRKILKPSLFISQKKYSSTAAQTPRAQTPAMVSHSSSSGSSNCQP